MVYILVIHSTMHPPIQLSNQSLYQLESNMHWGTQKKYHIKVNSYLVIVKYFCAAIFLQGSQYYHILLQCYPMFPNWPKCPQIFPSFSKCPQIFPDIPILLNHDAKHEVCVPHPQSMVHLLASDIQWGSQKKSTVMQSMRLVHCTLISWHAH